MESKNVYYGLNLNRKQLFTTSTTTTTTTTINKTTSNLLVHYQALAQHLTHQDFKITIVIDF